MNFLGQDRLYGSDRHTDAETISIKIAYCLRSKIRVIFIIYFAFVRSLATACKEVQQKGPAYRRPPPYVTSSLLYGAYFRISWLLFRK